jgi:nucleoside-diphosphate-sugar epimerase
MDKVKICVVGGSGFIGTRLVAQLLADGHQVSIFDLVESAAFPELVMRGDVRDAAAVLAAVSGCDVVIHLAAVHRDDVRPVSSYAEVNVGGAEHVVAAMKRSDITRCMLVSSVAVYGLTREEPDEQRPLAPDSPYGASKVASEAVFRDWHANGGPLQSLVILRPVVVFGEGNRGNVYNLIEQIRRGRFVMVGRGDNRKSVAYVDNLVDFMCSQMEPLPGVRTFNFADKPDRSVGELVASIDRLLGRESQRRLRLPYWMGLLAGYCFDGVGALRGQSFPVSAARVRKFCADTSVTTRALDATGFRPNVTVDQGLQRMIATLEIVGGPHESKPVSAVCNRGTSESGA